MNIFNSSKKETVFYNQNNCIKKTLEELNDMLEKVNEDGKKLIEEKIKLINCGIYGENQIDYELKNSNIPMYILKNIRLQKNEKESEIDFLVITKKLIYIIECKNLIGNIDVDNKGNFTRKIYQNGYINKKSTYSPITQNERHMRLIKEILLESKTNFISRLLFKLNFEKKYISIVVLANNKTILNDRYAKKEVKDKIVKIDQLVNYIESKNKESKSIVKSKKEMEKTAIFFSKKDINREENIFEKYKDYLTDDYCKLCGNKMVKKQGKFGFFYGCSNHPNCRYTRK